MPRERNKVGLELSELIQGNVHAELPADSDMSVLLLVRQAQVKLHTLIDFFPKYYPQEREKAVSH
jgi:hypothetical protein